MQKLIIKNKYQSPNRINILTAAGIAQINEPISPQNGERIWGGLGVVTFNQASQYSEEGSPNDPITPPDCPNCGGIEPEPSVPPGANCEKKNISELKQILDDYANQSFCDKEFPEVQFSTLIGKDSSGNDSEIRLLCPVDDCQKRGRLSADVSKELRLGDELLIYERRQSKTFDNMTESEALDWIYSYFQDACGGYISYGNKLKNCEYCTVLPTDPPPCNLCDDCACISGCNNRTIPNGSCDIFIQFNCNTPSIVYLIIYVSATLYLDDGTNINLTNKLDFSRYGTI